MIGVRFVQPFVYAFSLSGAPIPKAELHFYLTTSSTEADTFTDETLTTANPNPVIANTSGIFPAIFLDPLVIYKVTLSYPEKNSIPGQIIWTADPVVGGITTAMVIHIDHDTLAIPGILQDIIRRQPLDPLLYTVEPDSGSDSATAWNDRVAPALLGYKREVVAPTGVSKINHQIDLGENVMLKGNGMGVSIIHVQNPTGTPDFQGGILLRSGMRLRDMTIKVDRNGENTCAGYTWPPGLEDVHFDNVEFVGVGKVGEWGGFMGGDATGLHFTGCRASNLDLGLVPLKDNSHTSTQSDFHWLNCIADGCTDGFNINSPKGVFRDWSMMQCVANNCTQFPFSLAGPGCYDGRIDISGRGNPFELVHIEDAVGRIRGRISGERNNLQRGIPPGPNTNFNGAVYIIGGANNLIFDLTLDCTMDVGGSPNGVVILAGGPRVSDGLTVAPNDITLSGSINLKNDGTDPLNPTANHGCIGVVALDVTLLHFDHLILINAVPATKSQRMLYLPGCDWSGSIEVINPGVILETNNVTPGGFGSLEFSGDIATAPVMVFQKGLATPRTGSDIASEMVTNQPFTVNPAADWQKIMPAMYSVRGEFSFAYKGPTSNQTYQGAFQINKGALVPTNIFDNDPAGATVSLPTYTGATVTTGTTAVGASLITTIASLANVEVGCPVSGAGIPAGAFVVSLESGNSVKISALATAAGVAVPITFTPPMKSTMLFQINAGWLEAHLFKAAAEAGNIRFKLTGLTAFPNA